MNQWTPCGRLGLRFCLGEVERDCLELIGYGAKGIAHGVQRLVPILQELREDGADSVRSEAVVPGGKFGCSLEIMVMDANSLCVFVWHGNKCCSVWTMHHGIDAHLHSRERGIERRAYRSYFMPGYIHAKKKSTCTMKQIIPQVQTTNRKYHRLNYGPLPLPLPLPHPTCQALRSRRNRGNRTGRARRACTGSSRSATGGRCCRRPTRNCCVAHRP